METISQTNITETADVDVVAEPEVSDATGSPKTPTSSRLSSIPPYVDGEVYLINVADLEVDPLQPRKCIDRVKLEELVHSVRKNGLINPITFADREGRLIVVAGNRRLLAFKEAGFKMIRARYVAGNEAVIALAENIIRDDLTAVELAEGFSLLQDREALSNKQLAEIFHKSESIMSQLLSISRLPEEIKETCRGDKRYPLRDLARIAVIKDGAVLRTQFESLKRKIEGSNGKSKTRRIFDHFVGDACVLGNEGGDGYFRVHQSAPSSVRQPSSTRHRFR